MFFFFFFLSLDTYNCGFTSEVKLQQCTEKALLLEDSKILSFTELVVTSVYFCCSLKQKWGWGSWIPSLAGCHHALSLLSHQAAPVSLTMTLH